jgi:hypothetical protein
MIIPWKWILLILLHFPWRDTHKSHFKWYTYLLSLHNIKPHVRSRNKHRSWLEENYMISLNVCVASYQLHISCHTNDLFANTTYWTKLHNKHPEWCTPEIPKIVHRKFIVPLRIWLRLLPRKIWYIGRSLLKCIKILIWRWTVSHFTYSDEISLLLKYNVYVKYFFSIWFLYYSVFKEQQIYSLSNIPAHCCTNSDMHRFHVINERRRCNTLYFTSASCILRICEDAHFWCAEKYELYFYSQKQAL